MPEEKLPNENEQIKGDQGNPYLDALKSLKDQNSALSAKVSGLEADNKRLMQDFVNGQKSEEEVKVIDPERINKLRAELFKEDCELNNLQYCEKTLELREALIEIGEPDIFLPIGSKYKPSIDDKIKAANVVEGLKHCIEVAEGDSAIFTRELQRITQDVY